MARRCWKNFHASVRRLNDVFLTSYELTKGKIIASYRKFRVLSREKKNNEIGDPSEKLCPF